MEQKSLVRLVALFLVGFGLIAISPSQSAFACALCGNPNHLSGTPLPPLDPVNGGSGSLIAGNTNSITSSGASFSIVINGGTGLQSNPAALAAFNRAAAEWSQYITNPITININADLTSTGFASSNIIGQTSSTFVYDSFDTVRNAIANQALSQPGNNILSALPTQSQFNANVASGMTLGKSFIVGTSANFKALGYTSFNYTNLTPTTSDGTITFNSAFNFDYDSSNGIDSGKVDFQTVAAHEIGHILGFTSAVDDADYFMTANPNATIYARPLDLFRFSSASMPTSGSTFTSGVREFTPGSSATFSDTSVNYSESTGSTYGDGSQASHWKDDGSGSSGLNSNYIGLMDPSLPNGVREPITSADLRAFDLIGYNIRSAATPEPNTGALLAAIAAGLGFPKIRHVLRRRRRTLLISG